MLIKGMPVYYFEIKIDFVKDNITTDIKENVVLDSNKNYFVINDDTFTTLKYKHQNHSLFTEFRKARVFHSKIDPHWDYIRGYIYTHNSSKKIAYKTIRKALEKFLYEKYGKYCKGIDILNSLEV